MLDITFRSLPFILFVIFTSFFYFASPLTSREVKKENVSDRKGRQVQTNYNDRYEFDRQVLLKMGRCGVPHGMFP